MTDLNKVELRRLAEMASPAYEWYAPGDLRYADDKTGEVHGLDHDDDSFIAAAGPATILSLLDELEALQWISAEDRLPDHDGPFMCWFGLEEPSCIQQRVCIFIHRQGIFSDGSVTHWMPLNEAPVREVKANG